MTVHVEEDIFSGSKSKLLAPARLGPRRSPSRQSINGRRSSASLRPSTLAQSLGDDASNGLHSLAHELAAALMPEPSPGAKLLAEEFGIEYDEGAEGIDGHAAGSNVNGETLDHELDAHSFGKPDSLAPTLEIEPPDEELDAQYALVPQSPLQHQQRTPVQQQDPMDILSRDLETTENFLTHLRHLDADAGPSSHHTTLEKIASDMIRRINDSARDREGQVRELLEYEREFRKIAGEVGGDDVLGQLDALEEVEGLVDNTSLPVSQKSETRTSETVSENHSHLRGMSQDWEMNPDDHRLGDDLDGLSEPESPTPMKDSFLQAPPVHGPPTAATAIPQLVHLRTITASLASSLTTISEHAQVNGAANADAGRKIRALKNKLGGWRAEWDGAERSRIRIERWEAGLGDDEGDVTGTPPRAGTSKRVDGRRLVEEQLRAFGDALADAGRKTQAIMAAS